MHAGPGRPLAEDDVDCWFFEIDRFDAGELADVLSPDERERAARFVFEHDRLDYVVCRGVLRRLLSACVGGPASSLRFDYGPFGKPALHAAHGIDLHFNLAHSHGAALVGLARSTSLGVDLERVRTLPDMDLLVAAYFAAEERAAFAALPPHMRPRGFYAGWTRKEAVLKATGDGLARPLQSFAVTIAPDEVVPRLLRDDTDSAASARWTIADLSPEAGIAAAMAIRRPGARVTARTLDPAALGLTPREDKRPRARFSHRT